MKSNISKMYTIDKFKGINLTTDISQIDDNESPDMLNFELDIEGALHKRTGYKKIIDTLGPGDINGQYNFKRREQAEVWLFTHNTKLYSLNDRTINELYDGLNDARTRFFTMKDKCYIIDGKNYLAYDGTKVEKPTPFVPTIFRNGEPFEDFNLLGNRFKCVFSPDGTQKLFTVGVEGLDETEVKASLDGGKTWVTTGFTVDKAKGEITFTTAPEKGIATLVIEAGKTDNKKPEMINLCTVRVFYGGSNDTRVILSGNPKYPNRLWRSGLYDPTYFPENAYIDVGADNESIMNFTKQYHSLIVIKERSVYQINFDTDKQLFTTKLINEQSGAIAINSVQMVDNNPIWLDGVKGVCILRQTNIQDEKNVKVVSEKINKRLLREPNLKNAVTLDYNFKYHIFINGYVYIWDYRQDLWYIWDNVNAKTFMVNKYLYFGDNNGTIHRFMEKTEDFAYNDNGVSIKAHWYSKLLNFGADYREKTVRKLYYSILPADRTSISIYSITDTSEEKLLVKERVDLQRFDIFWFEPYSFISNSLPLNDGVKSKVKKVVYFQIKIENSELDESLGFISLSFEVQPGNFRK